MNKTTLHIDSKGRLCIPAEMRDQIGDVAIVEKTAEGLLITPGKKVDSQEEFRRLIHTPPRRTGKPKFATPDEMKSIWRTTA